MSPVNEDLNNLLRQLDRKANVSWLPEMKLGRPAYDCIRQALLSGTLTANQQRNALRALSRLRSHASDQEVFQLCVQFANHPDKRVRSTAVQLGIGLLRLRRILEYITTPVATDSDITTFRHALDLGIEQSVDTLLREYLAA